MKNISIICLIALIAGVFAGCSNSKKQQSNVVEAINERNEYTRNNIKSYTITRYEYKFGKIDTLNAKLKEYFEYDKNGNLIEHHDLNILDEITKNSYNDTVLIEATVYKIDGTLKRRHFYSYSNNCVIDSIFERESPPYRGKITYYDVLKRDSLSIEYNSDNKLREKRTYDEYGLKSETYIFRYIFTSRTSSSNMTRENNDKYVKKYLTKDGKGNIEWDETKTYDEKGRLNNCVSIGYRYNASGNLIKTEYQYIDNTHLVDQYITYDRKGDQISLYKYDYTKF